MFKMNRSAKGFTLIELLVVIAIIAVLSAIVIASLNSTRTKARNAARAQTVRELAKAMILANDASNSYPTTGGNWFCLSTNCGGAMTNATSATIDAAIAPFISKPDPVRGHGSNLESWGVDYNYPTTPAPSPSNGALTFPPGAYLYYAAEGTGSSVCPVGVTYDWTSYVSGSYVLCIYQLP